MVKGCFLPQMLIDVSVFFSIQIPSGHRGRPAATSRDGRSTARQEELEFDSEQKKNLQKLTKIFRIL
jgi:hypothetical protein